MTVIHPQAVTVAPRRARRVAVRAFRPQRTWPAVVAAVAVAIVAVIVAVEAVATILGRQLGVLPLETITGALEPLAWQSAPILVAAGVACLVGVVLLFAALVPGRGGYIPLRTDDPHLVVGVSRSGLRRNLASAVADVDGVHGARVSVGRRRVTVRAGVWSRPRRADRKATARDLRSAAQERLNQLDPLRRPRVRAKVRNLKG